MLLNIKNIVLIGISCLVLSCESNKQEDIEDLEHSSSNTISDTLNASAQNVFNTIPGRDKILSLAQVSQAEYNPNALNSPDNINKYTLESSQALNLGTYGSDLNVASVFEQSQESMLFLKCVNGLAKKIGVSNAFDEKMIDRIEKNKENRDSTLEIISQAFKNADVYLKANGRPGTSSLIVAGAWIEGVFTACTIAKETKSEPVIKEIFSQEESLTHLTNLLVQSKISEEVSYLIADLNTIKNILHTKTDNVYTLDALKDLDIKISDLRTKIISAK